MITNDLALYKLLERIAAALEAMNRIEHQKHGGDYYGPYIKPAASGVTDD